MKKLMLLLLIAIFFMNCETDVSEEPEKIIVTINSNDVVYYNSSTSFYLTYTGDLKEATFYLDGQSIGSSILPPFSFNYMPSDLAPGDHQLSCLVTSNKGNKFTGTKTINLKIRLGDTYKGGKVFYIDNTETHGLISSTTDLIANGTDNFFWGPSELLNTDNSNGLLNTQKMANASKNAYYAGYHFKTGLLLNGYNDWYIPSINELILLKDGQDYVGGFSTNSSDARYWSSSEVNAENGHALNLVALMGGTIPKGQYSYKIRPIKKF